jgi:N-formylglutamate amidohydrolase
MKEVILDIPHGGTTIPDEVKPHMHERFTVADLKTEYDIFSDELYLSQPGIPQSNKAFFDYHRTIIDVNRALDDFSRDGVVKTHTTTLRQIYKQYSGLPRQLALYLIEKYAAPYQENLRRIASEPIVKLVFSGHTMAPVGLLGSVDTGKKRPLFSISNGGDKDGNPEEEYQTPRDIMELIRDTILSKLPELDLTGATYNGKIVSFNSPFQGRQAIERLGRKTLTDKKAVQFEVNKSLLCKTADDNVKIPRPDNIAAIRKMLGDIFEEILSRIS